jgi:hypothetical protein
MRSQPLREWLERQQLNQIAGAVETYATAHDSRLPPSFFTDAMSLQKSGMNAYLSPITDPVNHAPYVVYVSGVTFDVIANRTVWLNGKPTTPRFRRGIGLLYVPQLPPLR